ncbi:MerR family transcriptional regulator [Convivina intestini]|uniref:DNA-binding transcriptional MerR regulator n=1 Tax=Convivina intestini TaxID=1505726 RepID=A0A2U1D9L8_9LACO|nr:MerR family transcriptional regulator [Convivina intestini]PVY84347.1 DNA-binding transcriptional MerR regulator [Convivina intestini]CAH1857056.1 HTH-type transcriptional regulator AdhR [Convivina intestini]SDC06627.1 DNA-binding transcriptional regulator, MerR family [Leuconostocaceae bacterium R-53105]
MAENYQIAEVAKLSGFSIATLRYYEELGLLKPARDRNNYRIFSDNDLRWIDFIKRAKATGLSLNKIIDYAKLREQGNQTIKERMAILDEQEQFLLDNQREIQDHIDFLKGKKNYYRQMLNQKSEV